MSHDEQSKAIKTTLEHIHTVCTAKRRQNYVTITWQPSSITYQMKS